WSWPRRVTRSITVPKPASISLLRILSNCNQDREVKMRKLKMLLAIVSLLIAASAAGAKTPAQSRGKQPIYTITVNVVERSTKAVNYQHRNGSTTIDFKGTILMPSARGEAKVESK